MNAQSELIAAAGKLSGYRLAGSTITAHMPLEAVGRWNNGELDPEDEDAIIVCVPETVGGELDHVYLTLENAGRYEAEGKNAFGEPLDFNDPDSSYYWAGLESEAYEKI
jgi:hypothetical protein